MVIKSTVLDPVKLQNDLTMEMIDAIEVAIKHLSQGSQNPYAFTLNHNLEASKSYDLKRRAITDIYINCLQLISFINLGKDTQLSLEDFTLEVHKMFYHERKNGNGK